MIINYWKECRTKPSWNISQSLQGEVLSPTYFPMYFVWWWEYFVWC